MDSFILLLSKENINLAKEEAIALLKPKKVLLKDNLLLVKATEKQLQPAKRLAYTKKVYRLLFECSNKKLEESIKRFHWQKIYKTSFSLRFRHNPNIELRLAGCIWNKIKAFCGNPRVDLKNAKTQIEILLAGKIAYCCLLLYSVHSDFEARKPHLRPGFMPISLHPKLARCLVNLTGIEKGVIVDPFCGTGGILIEAGLIGLNVFGSDIDEKMLSLCRKNFEYYKIKKFQLAKKDALTIKKVEYVATDLPYGKNTKKQDLEKLYAGFLEVLSRNLGKKAVVVMPDFISYKKFIPPKLKLIKQFSCYLHRSLTKRILVLAR